MPNHVDIRFTAVGRPDRIHTFVSQARGTRKPSGDEPGSLNYTGEQKESAFEFDCLIPLPKEYSQVPYSSGGDEMEWRTWGVKWGAYNVEEPVLVETSATYSFTCAWDAPHLFCVKLSDAWPDLLIAVSYGGEGPTLGRFALLAGTYLDSAEGDIEEAPSRPGEEEAKAGSIGMRRVWAAIRRFVIIRSADTLIGFLRPSKRFRKVVIALRSTLLTRFQEHGMPEEEEEEAWIEAYWAWVQHYLEDHEVYVASLIADHPFPPPKSAAETNGPSSGHTVTMVATSLSGRNTSQREEEQRKSFQDTLEEMREMARLYYILYQLRDDEAIVTSINCSTSHEYDSNRIVDGKWYSSEKEAQQALIAYKIERRQPLTGEEQELTREALEQYPHSDSDEDE